MTRWLLALALILPLSLTGCGKTDSEKAKEKAEDGNGMIAEMNKISQDLASKGLGFTYYSFVTETEIVSKVRTQMATMSSSSLTTAKDQYAQYASLSSRVLNIIDSKNIFYGGSRSDIVRWNALATRLQTEATVAIASALSTEAKDIADKAKAAAEEASSSDAKQESNEEEKTAESEAQSA